MDRYESRHDESKAEVAKPIVRLRGNSLSEGDPETVEHRHKDSCAHYESSFRYLDLMDASSSGPSLSSSSQFDGMGSSSMTCTAVDPEDTTSWSSRALTSTPENPPSNAASVAHDSDEDATAGEQALQTKIATSFNSFWNALRMTTSSTNGTSTSSSTPIESKVWEDPLVTEQLDLLLQLEEELVEKLLEKGQPQGDGDDNDTHGLMCRRDSADSLVIASRRFDQQNEEKKEKKKRSSPIASEGWCLVREGREPTRSKSFPATRTCNDIDGLLNSKG
eukprot:CAMPEP_0194049270 /NCGR_PEP_ID=MMETSP0009_2-20130614/30197_1 /TAXON_ID=210454 /ORGANISM="Grammatophora oceanica, Strain CCMP 410" /LENGTH=276 /DNA_ID=CAMNT_0038695379 /DNA_START=1 /DNA_END=829 /DNA_ORIENTATION=+